MAKNRKKKPTLKTIAYMTGLGVATISKALNDAPDIKKSTKERIKLIAKEIGYKPDRAGQRLRTGKTNVISLILNTQEEVTSMTTEFIFGISEALKTSSYTLVLTPYSDDEDPMKPVRSVVEASSADGIILSRIETRDRRVAYLDKSGTPFVTHGRTDMGIEHAYYDFDCFTFALNAVQLLAEKGAKRTSLLAPPAELAFAKHMQDGYNQGLQDTGMDNQQLPSATLYDSLELIADQVCTLLKKKNNPDGFICGSVSATIGVVGGIEKAGLVVGKDVHIVAKQSPTNLLKWFGRSIYAIDDDFTAAGFGAARSLIEVIDGAPISEHQTVAYPEKWGQTVL